MREKKPEALYMSKFMCNQQLPIGDELTCVLAFLCNFKPNSFTKQTRKKLNTINKAFMNTVNVEEILSRQKDTVPSREKDFMANHFCQNAAHRPYVH